MALDLAGATQKLLVAQGKTTDVVNEAAAMIQRVADEVAKLNDIIKTGGAVDLTALGQGLDDMTTDLTALEDKLKALTF